MTPHLTDPNPSLPATIIQLTCPAPALRSPGTVTGTETQQPNVNKPKRT
jgi:hypothetical protein